MEVREKLFTNVRLSNVQQVLLNSIRACEAPKKNEISFIPTVLIGCRRTSPLIISASTLVKYHDVDKVLFCEIFIWVVGFELILDKHCCFAILKWTSHAIIWILWDHIIFPKWEKDKLNLVETAFVTVLNLFQPFMFWYIYIYIINS